MKKLVLLLFVSIVGKNTFAQNFFTLCTPGYQLAGFKGKNVRYNSLGEYGELKGSTNHILFKGDGIAGNMLFGLDVSAVMLTIVRGIKNPSGSY